jgi:hypothetical protein
MVDLRRALGMNGHRELAVKYFSLIGDEAFRAGELDLAEAVYERLQDWPERRVRMLLKLSDVKHLPGDVEAERALRESIYGRLDHE